MTRRQSRRPPYILTVTCPHVRYGKNTFSPYSKPNTVKSRLTGKDPEAGKDRKQKKRATEDETVGWHHQFNAHEFEQIWGIVKDREA